MGCIQGVLCLASDLYVLHLIGLSKGVCVLGGVENLGDDVDVRAISLFICAQTLQLLIFNLVVEIELKTTKASDTHT